MPGVPGAIGQIFVKHVSGGVSEITFKTYNAGQPAFESAAVDYAHLDEECPRDIYAEVAMRTMRKKGIIYLTFTPDEGLTDTTLYFFDEGDFSGGARDGKYIVIVAWTDVPHITADQRKAWLAAIPLHLRDAKTKGIPYLGSGTIYPVDEEEIVCKPFKIPEYWARCFGLDVGYTHPTAAVWLAWDRDNDVVYVYDEYRRSEAEPRVHASAIKDRGKWIPGVIDPAGMQRSKIDGRQLAVLYHNEGVNLQLDERVNNAQEAGIMEILTRFNAGRLKIFNTCQKLIQERRIYRRDARGLVVKKYDDLLDALRYATMSGLPLAQAEADLYDDNVIPYRQAAGRNPVTGY
jgi:phage terminase large subunit-like protein